jgi:hypothetical protein
MAVSYNRNFGAWQVDGRGAYDTQEAAQLAESSGASGAGTAGKGPDTLEFDMGGIQAKAPDDPGNVPNPNNPGGISDNELAKRRRANSTAATSTANINLNRSNTNRTTTLAADGSRVAIDPATAKAPIQTDYLGPRSSGPGSVTRDGSGNVVRVRADNYAGESADIAARMGTVTDHGFVGGVQELGFEQPASPGPGGAGGGTGPREENAANATGEAAGNFNDEDTENQAINAQSWGKAWGAVGAVKGGDYGLSDEARGYQREGLQQQRDLIERLMGFDADKYAAQFGDQALARTVAAGRSQGGGAAAQQAGVFAAMDQAPALYAEGARQASQLENQRLGAAETAAQNFGQLGTMTRGQDEQRAQFESNLSLELANSVANLTQGQVQLNQQESQMFAEMWTDFAQLQSVYAGMDSNEQIAWWQREAQERGQDKQLEGILASLRADGAISAKDLVGGLFTLGGGIISSGGTILAAQAGKK